MPAFRFKARDSSGKVVTGVVQADHLRDARYRIEGRGQQVIELKPAVLPKPKPDLPARSTGMAPATKRNISLVLFLILVLAVFYYTDPLGLRPAYGLP